MMRGLVSATYAPTRSSARRGGRATCEHRAGHYGRRRVGRSRSRRRTRARLPYASAACERPASRPAAYRRITFVALRRAGVHRRHRRGRAPHRLRPRAAPTGRPARRASWSPPSSTYHAMVEFVNRMITGAGVGGRDRWPCSARWSGVPRRRDLTVAVVGPGGRRDRPRSSSAAWSCCSTCRPALVMGHFLAVDGARLERGRAPPPGRAGRRRRRARSCPSRSAWLGRLVVVGRRRWWCSPARSSPAPAPTAATRRPSGSTFAVPDVARVHGIARRAAPRARRS